jgi:hypothetical protein
MISKRGILLLCTLAMGYSAMSVKAEPPTEGTSIQTEDVEINVDSSQGIEVNTGQMRISVPSSTNTANQLSPDRVEEDRVRRCPRSSYYNSQSTQTSNSSYNVQRSTQSNLPRPTCN